MKYQKNEAQNLKKYGKVAAQLLHAGRKLPSEKVDELETQKKELRERFNKTNTIILALQEDDPRPKLNDGTITYDTLWNQWIKKYNPQDPDRLHWFVSHQYPTEWREFLPNTQGYTAYTKEEFDRVVSPTLFKMPQGQGSQATPEGQKDSANATSNRNRNGPSSQATPQNPNNSTNAMSTGNRNGSSSQPPLPPKASSIIRDNADAG